MMLSRCLSKNKTSLYSNGNYKLKYVQKTNANYVDGIRQEVKPKLHIQDKFDYRYKFINVTRILQTRRLHLCLNHYNHNVENSKNVKDLILKYAKLKKSNKFDVSLSSKLIEAYIKEGQLEDAKTVIQSTRKEIKHFFVKATIVKLYIDKCIETHQLKEAKKFISQEVNQPKDGKIFAASLADLSIAFADHGWHEDVLDILNQTETSKILNDRQRKEFSRILTHYVDQEDLTHLEGKLQV